LSFQTDFDIKERVRTASDIVDVIGRDLEMRPQGRNFVVRCPFHNDTKPSMTVNPERQSWKCWVCDIGGDVFSYVMQREGLDFPTALRMLAERAGIELPEFRRGPKTQPGDPNDKPTLVGAIKEVAQAYYEQLDARKTDDAKMAWDYLASRGIDDENRKRFRIGFAPDSWDFAVNLLKRKNYTGEVAIACGVARSRSRSGSSNSGSGSSGADGCYDFFRGRLMFPINNAQGGVISLGGRILPAIAERTVAASGGTATAGAKYFNGPETLLYHKSSELYGLDLARDAIRSAGEVLVMEGYTDVVATRMAGIENAVAVLGTALTQQHVRVLKRFAPRVVLVLDGDDAGRRRAEEVLELFVTADADLRILTLPDNADPADFLAVNPAKTLLDMAASAPDAVDHKISRLIDGVDLTRDTHRVTTAIETLLGLFVKVPQNDDRASLKVDQLLMRMSRTFELPVDRMSRRLDAMRAARQESEAKKSRYQKQASADAGGKDSERVSRSSQKSQPVSQPVSQSDSQLDSYLDSYSDVNVSDPFAGAAAEDAAMFGIDDSFSAPSHRRPSSRPSRRDDDSHSLSGVERELFEILLESPEVAAMAIEAIDPEWLHSTTSKMMLSAFQELDLNGHELNADSLMTLIENEFLKNQIITLQQRIEVRGDRLSEGPRERYATILTRFHEREFEAEKSRQIVQLESATLPEDEELAVLRAIIDAERIRHSPR